MSMISCSTPGKKGSQQASSQVMLVDNKQEPRKRVLEEDEYLGRMARIIKRDFFSSEQPSGSGETSSEYDGGLTNRTEYTFQGSPGTDRTESSTRTTRSRRQACSLGLNDFLAKYTSEDNEYFDKLQRKELRRHRSKYPWLYKEIKGQHNKQISDQLTVLSVQDQAALGDDGQSKMIDWPHNPMNSLFYPPNITDKPSSSRSQSTVNYKSNKYINDPVFKLPVSPTETSSNVPRISSGSRFADKIGVDGKLLDGSETPSVNGYSFIPAPETPRAIVLDDRKIKTETNKFYIPVDSPRDELAHRIYQEKVAKNIRTPAKGCAPVTSETPSSRRGGYADFSFSPERIKTPRSKLR